MVLIINHTQKMLDDGLIQMTDYNYPLVQFYKYKHPARLKGAVKSGNMLVEYAVILRIEFIPEGAQSGPVKEVYFKIFKKGTCGIIGAVLGWPALDHPVMPGGEGLGWVNRLNGVEYSALGVTIPRLDDARKSNYNQSVARYTASNGQLMAIDDVTGDRVSLIGEYEARQFRAAALLDSQVPVAKMEPIGLQYVVLSPYSTPVPDLQHPSFILYPLCCHPLTL